MNFVPSKLAAVDGGNPTLVTEKFEKLLKDKSKSYQQN